MKTLVLKTIIPQRSFLLLLVAHWESLIVQALCGSSDLGVILLPLEAARLSSS